MPLLLGYKDACSWRTVLSVSVKKSDALAPIFQTVDHKVESGLTANLQV